MTSPQRSCNVDDKVSGMLYLKLVLNVIDFIIWNLKTNVFIGNPFWDEAS